jgi:16S rRNA (guanine1516-N2)-methyltransferase
MPKTSVTKKLPGISIAVSSTEDNHMLREKASDLAELLQLNMVPLTKQEKYNLLLVYTEKGLQIQLKQDSKTRRPATLHVDFLSDALTYRRQHGGGIKQALARAVGIKPGIRPSIIDATAGLGKDSFLLASLGCQVTMIERSPLLAALLKDALERAMKSEELHSDIKNKLTLLHGDAVTIIKKTKQEERVDTIYLDPMYPHSRKSALNRLEMRVIRELVGDDTDAARLLETALLHAIKRVVVKRPKGAPLLNEQLPAHVIKMKNSRYDVYMI